MSKHDEFALQWMDFDDYQANFQEDFIAASVTEATGVTENASFPDHINKENYQPRTLVDQTLEIIDPTPQIHQLFVQFNNKFFNNVLLPVAIRWAPKMTSCAGTCSFHPRNGECIISLSQPLLKLRPRKDLVETLLHEMIHAYLFLTQNDRDRDGHGPEFCKHMHRINKEAGTNITIYHTFHAEVALYQQHKWLCDGPCRNRPPFFGKVKRAMNRAPGPSDRWFEHHRRTCGGKFIKIAEPEDYKKGGKSKDDAGSLAKGSKKKPDHNRTLDSWLSPPKDKSNGSPGLGGKNGINRVHGFGDGGSGASSSGTSSSKKTDKVGSTSGLTKLGTSTNNVHGWGTGGPGASSSRASPSTPSNPKFRESGVLGGGGNTGRSCLLDKFATPTPPKRKIIDLSTPAPTRPTVDGPREPEFQECPICHEDYPTLTMNEHVDDCLAWSDKAGGVNPELLPTEPKRARVDEPVEVDMEFQKCPICDEDYPATFMNQHVDECLTRQDGAAGSTSNTQTNGQDVDHAPRKPQRAKVDGKVEKKIVFHRCPFCRERFAAESLDDHVAKCSASGDDDPAMVLCDVCSTWVEIARLEQHVEQCVLGGMPESTATQSSCSSSRKEIQERSPNAPSKASPERCLICDVLIPSGVTLDQHLEVCNQMGSIYDSTGDDFVGECSICGKSLPLDVIDVHQKLCYDKHTK